MDVEKIEPKGSISDNLFQPAEHVRGLEEISRPSLSYWQDAWIRLRKNKKSFYSLFIVLFVICFSIFGPFVWRVDPSDQNLNFISQTPSFGKSAIVVDETYGGIPKTIEDLSTEPDEDVDVLGNTKSISFVGDPTT